MIDVSNLSRQDQIDYYIEQLSKVEFELVDNELTEKSKIFITELGQHFNQCFYILKFKVTNEFELLDGSLGTLSFLSELLNHKNLKPLIQEIMPVHEYYELKKDVKGITSLYTLLGDLCSLLVFGGAYSSGTSLKEEELIQSVKGFIDDFLPDGYKNYDYFVTYEPWSKWFCNVAWDITHIIINRNRKELNLICITDSD